jgi:hypothetical protein
MDVSIIECRENIVKEFRCGHSIETICFRATKQACTERCNKICEMGHICPFKCHFRSPCKCPEPVEKILPGCEHKQEMACSTDPESFKCQVIVNKTSTRCNGMTTSKFLYNIFPTFNYANIHMTVNCNAMPT